MSEKITIKRSSVGGATFVRFGAESICVLDGLFNERRIRKAVSLILRNHQLVKKLQKEYDHPDTITSLETPK